MVERCNVKVSIIIPMYNEGKTIERCINSVLAQSLKEVEILCCDDGSTDDTLVILKKMQKKANNIIVLHQENLGAGPARNKCLDIAHGDCICFLDADDYYLDEKALETLYTEMERYSLDMSCGLMQFKENEIISKDGHNRMLVKDSNCVVMNFDEYQYDFYFQCYMFKRKIIEENGLRFMPLWRYQDPPFLIDYFNCVNSFVMVPVEFYCYQKNQAKFNYDFKRVRDLLVGLKYELNVAIKNDYQILIKEIVNRLNDLYAPAILSVIGDKPEILKLLIEINESLSKEEIVLDVLRYITGDINQTEYVNRKVIAQIREKIPSDSNIVVYGAGKIGTKCINALKVLEEYDVIAWVDKYKSGIEKEGWILSSVDDITPELNAYILIALLDNTLACEVQKELVNKGISETVIILWNE